MKRLLPFLPLLLLAALLLFPSSAIAGGKQGVTIWWGHVLPALLPSFLCVKLAQELGLLQATYRHPKGRLAAVIGFSLVSGAPNGAKLLRVLEQEGGLSPRDSRRLLPFVNSVSPAFLLSIIASELLENKALFLPMAAAFYGCILGFLVMALPEKASRTRSAPAVDTKRATFSEALSTAIENGMLDMLRIGGCILLACTLLSVSRSILPMETAYAALAGFMEVSTGVSVLADLSLSLRLKASLMVGCAAFGGLSLGLQTLCCYPGLRFLPYLLKKLLFGVLVGVVCYLLFPLFPNVASAFASRQAALYRTLSLSAVLLSSALSLSFMGLLSLMIGSSKGD